MKRTLTFILTVAMLLSAIVFTSVTSSAAGVVTDEGRLPFEDVKSDYWYASQTEFCYVNGIVNGMNDYTFGGNGKLTRAQLVTMLANIEGVDTSSYNVVGFSDVKPNHWYFGAVAWAYQCNIVTGNPDGTFAPNKSLTRAELSVIMKNYMSQRYNVEVDYTLLNRFPDKPKSTHWYYDGIAFAVSAGLISGNSDGTLNPTGNVTRAQAAVIFNSFMENYFNGECNHSYAPATCSESSYCVNCGMKKGLPNGHTVNNYSCMAGGNCTICGAYVEASNILHKFNNATCTSAKVCLLCGETRGEALGHTTKNGICGRCGKDLFTNMFDRLVYYIKAKGDVIDVSDGKCHVYSLYHEDINSTSAICYYPSTDLITLENIYFYENGSYDITQMNIERGYTNIHEFFYAFYEDEQCIFFGEGRLDAATFSRYTDRDFANYELAGGYSYRNHFKDNMNIGLDQLLIDGHYFVNVFFGGEIADLGFVAFDPTL